MIGICKRSIGEVMKDGGKVGRSGLTILWLANGWPLVIAAVVLVLESGKEGCLWVIVSAVIWHGRMVMAICSITECAVIGCCRGECPYTSLAVVMEVNEQWWQQLWLS
jgi:hypothetical protein